MDSGFGNDDGSDNNLPSFILHLFIFFSPTDYNTYSKSLFDKGERKVYTARSGGGDDLGDAESQYKDLKRTDKFRPGKDFQGVDRYLPHTIACCLYSLRNAQGRRVRKRR
jgi:hypothetical protein